MRLLCFFSLFLVVIICFDLSESYARSQQRQVVKYASGTGFFVSRNGHVVTNAHVLQNCQSITVNNQSMRIASAKIVKIDRELDLAILKSSANPPKVAQLREQSTAPAIGDKVMVLGYPGDSARTGEYTIEYSHIKGLEGPSGDPKWVQFEDSAQQGNSGGPLLDFAGNVIGVVTAKTQIYRRNDLAARDELVGSSDVAVTLPTLKEYLDGNAVFYYRKDSVMQLSKRRMEETARLFTVSVLCKQSTEIVDG